jgi:hypothetical protein
MDTNDCMYLVCVILVALGILLARGRYKTLALVTFIATECLHMNVSRALLATESFIVISS